MIITCTGLWLTCFMILFLYAWLFFYPRLLSSGLLLLLSNFICNFVPQGNAWLWLSLCFFGDLKIWIFFTLLSLFCFLVDCDGDETVLFEMIITSTGLWLTCFMILFLYTRLWVFRGCSRLACYFFQNLNAILCLKVTLGFDWVFVFWRLESLDFLYFAVFVLYFIRLRWWWNCFLKWL